MSCCTVDMQGTDKFFSKHARRYARRFRKNGVDRCSELLCQGILGSGVQLKSILDIGCGVGGLHLTLLKEGAEEAIGVEVSKGMLDQARKLAHEMGLSERTRYYLGDFARMNGDGSDRNDVSIPPSDICVLDKVVCCYEDWKTLVVKSLALTRETYAVSYPRSVWYVRLFFSTATLLARLFRWSFHPFYHDWEAIQRYIRSLGFEKHYERKTIAWLAMVYRKQQGGGHP